MKKLDQVSTNDKQQHFTTKEILPIHKIDNLFKHSRDSFD